MSGMIKKIQFIKNMAVYQDFNWDKTVRDDKGNNIAKFKKINILYGRNYSGKTTLSRIFRALETGEISEKYNSPKFQVEFEGAKNVDQTSLKSHAHTVRVFNEDFVRENLKFIVDDDEAINSFAILGENNANLEQQVESIEAELGSEENKNGLIGSLDIKNDEFEKAKAAHEKKEDELTKKLREKANNPQTGIKHNKDYGNANYTINHIKIDIKKVAHKGYIPLNQEKKNRAHDLIKEEPKHQINEIRSFNLQYSRIKNITKQLLEKEIKVSAPIQELLSNAALEAWVRHGRSLHEGQKDSCGFCGKPLPTGLWNKLDKHFNQESEQLREDIAKTIESIENEKQRVSVLLEVKTSDFYKEFSSEVETLKKALELAIEEYLYSLDVLSDQLKKRNEEIFTIHAFDEPASAESRLNDVREGFENLREKSNQATTELEGKQQEARDSLRLNEVYTFIQDLNYQGEQEQIGILKKDREQAKKGLRSIETKIKEKKDSLSKLKAQLQDESKGADKVNYYLNNFFGHQSLSLRAIQESSEDKTYGYRFEVIRNETKAHHLSEGECSLIAFCYFMAKLEDIETRGSKPIIWIDDPISSLDSNHIFFVYSLINAGIVENENYLQLFISTHNLDFLKYLKKLPGASSNKKSQYFSLNRAIQTSEITVMPKHLREYVTEFNYLFHQIFKCASITEITDDNFSTFYNFGNNSRKFLEIYLYYKYPDNRKDEIKLTKFFDDESVPAILTSRVTNEYSHLTGSFERGAMPVEVPEIQRVAKSIISKIREVDRDQYSALLISIGEQDILDVLDLEFSQ